MRALSQCPIEYLRYPFSVAGSRESYCGAEGCSCEAESEGHSCAAGEGTSAGASDSCQPGSDQPPCRRDWDPAGAYGRFPGPEGMQRHQPCSARPHLSSLQRFRISVHNSIRFFQDLLLVMGWKGTEAEALPIRPRAWECRSPGHQEESPEMVDGWLTLVLYAGSTSAINQEARE